MKKIQFADKFKTISELCELNGRVYIELPNDTKGNAFMKRAEKEGFTFPDGAKPTDREYARIMAINKNKTIQYVNCFGAAAYGAGCGKIGDQKLIRIVY